MAYFLLVVSHRLIVFILVLTYLILFCTGVEVRLPPELHRSTRMCSRSMKFCHRWSPPPPPTPAAAPTPRRWAATGFALGVDIVGRRVEYKFSLFTREHLTLVSSSFTVHSLASTSIARQREREGVRLRSSSLLTSPVHLSDGLRRDDGAAGVDRSVAAVS